jgi:hypothetical protein
MTAHAGPLAIETERTGVRRLRVTIGVALGLHVALLLGSSWSGQTRLTLLRPVPNEIPLQVEEPIREPAARGGSSSPGELEAPEPPPEKPILMKPREVRAAPRVLTANAPAAPAMAPPAFAPDPDRMPVPSNSRAMQRAGGGGAGEGIGNGRGGLFGNGRFVGNGPGAFKARVCFIPETTRSVKQFERCDAVHEEFIDEINVPARRFEDGFPGFEDRTEWFSVTITGSFTLREPGIYRFRLKSDDGSRLFIDNQLVVDNDGIHDAISKRGEIELSEGRHRFLLEYFQGMKYILALQLFVTPPGRPERLFSSSF